MLMLMLTLEGGCPWLISVVHHINEKNHGLMLLAVHALLAPGSIELAACWVHLLLAVHVPACS